MVDLVSQQVAAVNQQFILQFFCYLTDVFSSLDLVVEDEKKSIFEVHLKSVSPNIFSLMNTAISQGTAKGFEKYLFVTVENIFLISHKREEILQMLTSNQQVTAVIFELTELYLPQQSKAISVILNCLATKEPKETELQIINKCLEYLNRGDLLEDEENLYYLQNIFEDLFFSFIETVKDSQPELLKNIAVLTGKTAETS